MGLLRHVVGLDLLWDLDVSGSCIFRGSRKVNSCITYVGIYGPYDYKVIRFNQRLDLEKVGDLSSIVRWYRESI
jgi:hypothetical protein